MRRVSLLAIVGLAVLATAGCERWTLDRQMKELCEKDGGVRVFEVVTLPASYFDSDGQVKSTEWVAQETGRAKSERLLRSIGKDEYRVYLDIQILKDGDPVQGDGRLRHRSWKIVRSSDGRLLGEAAQYARSGGDYIYWGHFSQANCPSKFDGLTALLSATLLKARE